MPVFDFTKQEIEKKDPVCTYTIFKSNEETATVDKPIMVLDNKEKNGLTTVLEFLPIP